MSEKPQPDRIAEKQAKYGKQDAWGNDLASLQANLRLTLLQRLRRAESAANSLQRLKRAIKRID